MSTKDAPSTQECWSSTTASKVVLSTPKKVLTIGDSLQGCRVAPRFAVSRSPTAFPGKVAALAPGKEYCVPSTVGLVHSPTAKIWVTTVCGLQTSQATTTNSLSFSVPPKTSHTYVKVMLMFYLTLPGG